MLYLTRLCMQKLCYSPASARAIIRGSAEYPEVRGTVSFYHMNEGSVVMAEIVGLPDSVPMGKGDSGSDICSRFFGFHIHEGTRCGGNAQDLFADAGGHFNPGKKEHPFHAGDMPPLLSGCGFAWTAFYTERFFPADVIGQTVIIHDMADDFSSQPSGNSGKKIACGKIIA